MKKLFLVMILLIGLLFILPLGNEVKATIPADQTSFVLDRHQTGPVAMAQEEGGLASTNFATEDPNTVVGEGNFFSDNWIALVLGLLAFIDLVARLTPTEKDNSIVNFLMTLFNSLIPNFKKGGGSFKLLSK